MKLLDWVNTFIEDSGVFHTWMKDKKNVTMAVPSNMHVIGTCKTCRHREIEYADMGWCKKSPSPGITQAMIHEDFGCIYWEKN